MSGCFRQSFSDVGLRTQEVCSNSILHGLSEVWSTETPIFIPSPAEYDLKPIDVLYGSYNPDKQKITLYVEAIKRDAHLFGDFHDFLDVVRMHEYAHAIVYCGISLEKMDSAMSQYDCLCETDWSDFLKKRLEILNKIDKASHEFLAQSITLSAIESLIKLDSSENSKGVRLRKVFSKLEERQLNDYHIPAEIKKIISDVEWNFILDAVRTETDIPHKSNTFNEDIKELCIMSAKQIAKEWTVPIEDSSISPLKESLASFQNQNPNGYFSLLINRLNSLKICVFSKEHPPPHFNVILGNESANYQIKDCKQLNGGLREYYCQISKWHKAHKALLIEKWNLLRPTDCPVGLYKED